MTRAAYPELSVICTLYRARLTPDMCERNMAMALRAAKLIWAGMGLKSVGWLDVDRMMVCGRCGKAAEGLAAAGVEMEVVYGKVKGELRVGWERIVGRVEGVEGGKGLGEMVLENKHARDKRWRGKAEVREKVKARAREWREKQKQKRK